MARKKVLRQLYALLARELGNERPPAMRNTVPLPLVDNIAFSRRRSFCPPDRNCETCPAAQLVDQIGMVVHSTNIGKSIRQVKPNLSDDVSRDSRKGFPQTEDMGDRPDADYRMAAGRRLRATRLAVGIPTIRRLAQLLDVPESNLTKWENGEALVPPWFVKRLEDHYGVTYQWIYDGGKRGLPHELVLKLDAKPST